MERLVRLASALYKAGDRGVPANNLAEIAGFTGVDPTTQLGKEFKYLRELGWQIDNIGGEGEAGIFRMKTVDNRIRLRLTPGQQAALLRAVLVADRTTLAERLGLSVDQVPSEVVAAVPVAGGGALAQVSHALQQRCLLRFRYNGSPRDVHPQSIRTQNGKWYLIGQEDGDESAVAKRFVVSRMSDVAVDAPDTARAIESVRHTRLHPMSWEIDPPVEVTLRAAADFAADVVRWLGEPDGQVEGPGGTVDFTYRVTNRSALRSRIYELGPRIEVLGPREIRDELIADLSALTWEA